MAGSHLLVATGRIPNSDTLNLSAAGVKTNKRGFIQVNDRLETSVKGIYALGDIKGGPAFTHISYDDFRIIRSNVIEKEKKTASTQDRMVPYACLSIRNLGELASLKAKRARRAARFAWLSCR